MVVRHHQIDFASGALVFPGGKIDDGDYAVADLSDGVGDGDATQAALMAGAIREAFEECGVLLARTTGQSDLIDGARLAELDHYREALHSNEMPLRQMLDTENLRLACDRLHHFAHWVTPPMMPKRFDTHFYLVAAPADHLAVHDGTESVDSVWISPNDAAAGAADKTYTIIFPTLRNVELLGESSTVADAVATTSSRDIVSVLPWTEKRDDGNYVCIPPEAGYAVTEERIPDRPS